MNGTDFDADAAPNGRCDECGAPVADALPGEPRRCPTDPGHDPYSDGMANGGDPIRDRDGNEMDEAAVGRLRLVRAVESWLSPAREAFRQGSPVWVAAAPGDRTLYPMLWVPPGQPAHTTYSPQAGGLPDFVPAADQATLCLPDRTVRVLATGSPSPGYVAEKIGTSNPYTVTAVGVVWALMVGNDAEDVAAWYTHPTVFLEWDADRFPANTAENGRHWAELNTMWRGGYKAGAAAAIDSLRATGADTLQDAIDHATAIGWVK